jgi:3-phosphoshikimate 1-carboxyvinyltransferase
MTNNAHWPAIYRGATPVDISVVIPGSKSVTNRALILAAQATSPSTLRRPLVSRDSELMVAGLKALGIGIEETTAIVDGNEELQWLVTPAPMRGGVRVDVGNAGTVMRFLPPLAALATGEVVFDGDPRSYERPLGPVIKALEELGVSIDHEDRYSLPLTLNGTGKIGGGEITIDASESSQFLSALLLVAPSFTNGIKVKHQGGSLPSMPHIEMTVDMLRQFGATVDVDGVAQTWSVRSEERRVGKSV